MASFKFYLDRRAVKNDEPAPLKLVISQHGKTVMISQQIFLTPQQWNERTASVINHPNKAVINNFLVKRRIAIETFFLKLDENGQLSRLSHIELKDRFLAFLSGDEAAGTREKRLIRRYFLKVMESKSDVRRNSYKTVLSRLDKFTNGKFADMCFEDIKRDWIIEFENYLKQDGIATNTRHMYLTTLSSVFNSAIDNEIISSTPFRHIRLKTEKTAKRSLNIEKLRYLMTFKSDKKKENFALDIFRLSFFLIGTNVADLFKFTTDNIQDGRLVYNRSKTSRLYSIKIEPEAWAIIERYKGDERLISFEQEEKQNLSRALNYWLEKYTSTLDQKITMYWARHSWATVAAYLEIPKETISAALGHGGNTVTDIYINFDNRKIDDANRRVIDYVLEKGVKTSENSVEKGGF